MANLATLAITSAISPALTTTPVPLLGAPRNLTIQGNFTYGSGGTSVDAYVQTSIDGGVTWCDICNFHFTTSSARKIFNLNSQTSETTQVTPTDGSIASNSAQDGILGTMLRVKYQSSGTYGGTTTLAIDVTSDQLK